MNAEQHALTILRAIQMAEKEGFVVTVDESHSAVIVADMYFLFEPSEEDEPWDMVVSG